MPTIFNTMIRDNDRVISIVGAGGKTSLMFLLAHSFQHKGLRVISSTTTRILKPDPEQSGSIILYRQDNFYNTLQHNITIYGHVTIAHSLLEANKLKGLSCEKLEHIFQHSAAQRMLIEADGARQLPLKGAGENEPVVPQKTDVFISVVGLDIVGQPLEEDTVFRAELVAERAGLPIGKIITPQAVARLALHPEGLLKGCPAKARSYIILNKSELPGGREKALAVIQAAQKGSGRKPDFWSIASVQNDSCECFPRTN